MKNFQLRTQGDCSGMADGRKEYLYEFLLANIGCILYECEPLVASY